MQQIVEPAVSPHLAELLIAAVGHAGAQLSVLMDRQVQLRGTHVEAVRLERLPGLLEDEDKLVTAVHLGFFGDLNGHVILSFSPEMALRLVASMLMMPVEELCFGEMEASALGEVGNITTASFLNQIADVCHLVLHPTPPTVLQDMIGALLSNVVVEMALDSSHALVLHTIFNVEGDVMQGELLLLPSATSIALLERQLVPC